MKWLKRQTSYNFVKASRTRALVLFTNWTPEGKGYYFLLEKDMKRHIILDYNMTPKKLRKSLAIDKPTKDKLFNNLLSLVVPVFCA